MSEDTKVYIDLPQPPEEEPLVIPVNMPERFGRIVKYFNGMPTLFWLLSMQRALRYLGMACVFGLASPLIILLLTIAVSGASYALNYENELLFFIWLSFLAFVNVLTQFVLFVLAYRQLMRRPLTLFDLTTQEERGLVDYLSWGNLYHALPKISFVLSLLLFLLQLLVLAGSSSMLVYSVYWPNTRYPIDGNQLGGILLNMLSYVIAYFGLLIVLAPFHLYMRYLYKVMRQKKQQWMTFLIYLPVPVLILNIIAFGVISAILGREPNWLEIATLSVFWVCVGVSGVMQIVTGIYWLVLSRRFNQFIEAVNMFHAMLADEQGEERA